jgi:hypothetical protein
MSTTLSAGSTPQESHAATVGLLLLGTVLAALWIGINLMFPGLAPTGIPSALTRLGIHAAILAGLWLGLSRTDFSMSKRIAIWLAIVIPFTLCLAIVWALAINGAFQFVPGVVRPQGCRSRSSHLSSSGCPFCCGRNRLRRSLMQRRLPG